MSVILTSHCMLISLNMFVAMLSILWHIWEWENKCPWTSHHTWLASWCTFYLVYSSLGVLLFTGGRTRPSLGAWGRRWGFSRRRRWHHRRRRSPAGTWAADQAASVVVVVVETHTETQWMSMVARLWRHAGHVTTMVINTVIHILDIMWNSKENREHFFIYCSVNIQAHSWHVWPKLRLIKEILIM